jgi:thiol:disulfide interchange protein DsbD
MKKLAAVTGIAFLLFSGYFLADASAQNRDEIISVAVKASAEKFQPGATYPLEIILKITNPYHINPQIPSDPILVPTTISLDGGKDVRFSSVEFPEPEVKILDFSEMPLAIYEGTLVLTTSVSLPENFSGSTLNIQGNLEYQACDDSTCMAPASLEFSRSFPVEGAAHVEEEIDDSRPAKKDSAEPANEGSGQEPVSKEHDVVALPQEGSFARTIGDKGLFLTFILIFLGGLALNLTPCVYPIIPITIGYFGGQAEGRKGGAVIHAFIYVLGMAVTYSALGLIAALTGSLFGSAMQNPVVLVAIALVLVTMALSMFNLYEFRLPSFLTSLAGGRKKGLFGTFFMGLTVGIVAAPCIGPFVLGLLTYVGEKGDLLLGFLMFFVLALGLGLPFLFLAIFSGSITKLPKSGAWMVWVRTIFGFILIAMAIYFLKPLFPGGLLYSLALGTVLFTGGIYMAWIEPTKLQGKAFPVIRNIIGLIFLVLAVFFASSGIQSYVDSRLSEVQMTAGAQISSDQIRWAHYSDDIINQAREEAKPVFLDFYADWCIPCKELDKFTFKDERIIDLSRKFVMVKVDLTKSSDPLVKKLTGAYGIKGVPTLVMLKAGGDESVESRIVGFIKPEGLSEKMNQALSLE